MTVSSSLSVALTGIRTTQQQLGVTSANIANAKSTGYSRQTISSSALLSNSRVYGVGANEVTREINLLVQKQWRTAAANSAYADTRVTSLSALDNYWGAPNSSSSLNSVFAGFTSSLQKLATTPSDTAVQGSAVSAAQNLVTRLNQLSSDVQSLRQEAESNISNAVSRMNSLLQTIAEVDRQIVAVGSGGNSTAGLQDKRDAAIDELSSFVDIQVGTKPSGSITISLTDGTQLYDDVPVTFGFDQQGVVDASRSYSTVDSERSLGTLTITSGPGAGVDLFKSNSIRSGKIAAWKELRDETLVDAQAQLDTIAATLSKAVSTRQASGTAVSDTTAQTAGYSLDASGLTEGNPLTVQYLDASVSPAQSRSVTFIAYDSATGSAPDGSFTPDPNDTVYAIDLSGTDDIATQIANRLNSVTGSTAFSGSYNSTSGALQISATTTSTTYSVTGLGGEISSPGDKTGYQAFDLFIDGSTGKSYTGLTNGKDNITGLAARLTVSPQVVADPSLLMKYSDTTLSGDGTRPQAILDALSDRVYSYSSTIGIGSSTTPFTGSFKGLLAQVVNTQGALVEDAQNVADGQTVVTSNLKERYDNSRSVDLDTELMSLIQLQNSYSANARVLSVAQELMDTLMNAFR